MKVCYNCEKEFDVFEWCWLVVNDETDKSHATFELSDEDYCPENGDRLVELEFCPHCLAEY